MFSTVEQITQRLIEGYAPERILLYGSRARGVHRPDSDIDILVIKDTTDAPIARRIAVERLLQDRAVALDIEVYTPREARRLYAAGCPFIEEVMETGKVLYMREAAQQWYDDARDELGSAEILLEHQSYKGACYHAQQCVEKGIKALLLESGQKPVKVHDIVRLKAEAEDLGFDVALNMDVDSLRREELVRRPRPLRTPGARRRGRTATGRG